MPPPTAGMSLAAGNAHEQHMACLSAAAFHGSAAVWAALALRWCKSQAGPKWLYPAIPLFPCPTGPLTIVLLLLWYCGIMSINSFILCWLLALDFFPSLCPKFGGNMEVDVCRGTGCSEDKGELLLLFMLHVSKYVLLYHWWYLSAPSCPIIITCVFYNASWL